MLRGSRTRVRLRGLHPGAVTRGPLGSCPAGEQAEAWGRLDARRTSVSVGAPRAVTEKPAGATRPGRATDRAGARDPLRPYPFGRRSVHAVLGAAGLPSNRVGPMLNSSTAPRGRTLRRGVRSADHRLLAPAGGRAKGVLAFRRTRRRPEARLLRVAGRRGRRPPRWRSVASATKAREGAGAGRRRPRGHAVCYSGWIPAALAILA